jgi:hypothetical protein
MGERGNIRRERLQDSSVTVATLSVSRADECQTPRGYKNESTNFQLTSPK